MRTMVNICAIAKRAETFKNQKVHSIYMGTQFAIQHLKKVYHTADFAKYC